MVEKARHSARQTTIKVSYVKPPDFKETVSAFFGMIVSRLATMNRTWPGAWCRFFQSGGRSACPKSRGTVPQRRMRV
jgi:hypothetical protein